MKRHEEKLSGRAGRNVGALSMRLAGVGLFLLLAAGCASPQMKGTPFYTGEYAVRRGPPEDRVALWPLLYYRDPALSVLWPFIEKTDDHFAVRPLMSVYGLQDEKQVYSVLWPISEFNGKTGENRVFPVFWGKDYVTAFPLYWHIRNPRGSEGVYDGLIPVWSYYRDGGGYSTHVLWPFFHIESYNGVQGWRVWPLAGSYADNTDAYRFFLWPFGHQWSNTSRDTFGHTLFPLYGYERDRNGSLFMSMLYCTGRKNNGDSWHFAPLMYQSSDRDGSRFLSPLYSQGGNVNGSNTWSLLLPVYYSEHQNDERLLATLLGGYKADKDGYGWVAVPLLSGGTRDKDSGQVWMVGPLAHYGWDKDSSAHHVFPLYYSSQDTNGSMFLSLPWSSGQSKEGSWQLVPPVFLRMKDRHGEKLFTPLYSAGSSSDGKDSWHTLLPLYYTESSGDRHLFATLLGGCKTDKDGYGWLAMPLLSGGSRDRDSGQMWFVGPIAHYGWDKDSSAHHVFPLYYSSQDTHGSMFLSLPWSSSHSKDGSWQLVPPLFYRITNPDGAKFFTPLYSAGSSAGGGESWDALLPLYYAESSGDRHLFATLLGGYKSDSNRLDWLAYPLLSGGHATVDSGGLWLLAPFFHAEWNKDTRSHHLLPLYYWDGQNRTFISPLYARWLDEQGQAKNMFVPLLSLKTAGKDREDMWLAGGLGHFSWGKEAGPQHVFPLCYWNTKTGTFVSPLAAKWGSGDGTSTTMIPPALSWLSAQDKRSDLWMVGPLAHFSWGEKAGSQHILPLYYYDPNDGTFLSLLTAKWQDGDTGKWLIPPALSYLTSNDRRSDLWLVGGMGHFSWGKEGGPQHVLPLYYWNTKTGTFVSAVAAKWARADGTSTTMIPPALSWMSAQDKRSDLWMVGPLAHFSWGEKAGSQHILPLYYYDPNDGTFLSLLTAKWQDGDTGKWLIPPALSYLTSNDRRKDLWLAAGMGHFSWGKEGDSQHLIPLFYWNAKTRTFVSLAAAKWDFSGGGTTYMFPPALSWLSAEEKEKNLWVVGPLAHFSWGEWADAQHVLPLYYYSRRDGTFVSLPACRWKDGGTTRWLVPPLLSGYSSDGKSSSVTALLGLAHNEWGEGPGLPHGYALPLYFYESGNYFYTPLFGWRNEDFIYPLTPLVGIRTGSQSGSWLFPFYNYKRDDRTDNVDCSFLLWGGYERARDSVKSSMFPFYSYASRGSVDAPPLGKDIEAMTEYGTETRILLLSWYRNQLMVYPGTGTGKDGAKAVASRRYVKENGFFPLWNYSSKEVPEQNREDVDGSFLWLVYDYLREVRPVSDKAGEKEVNDYTRARVLWHAWHYERTNGDVSVDMFPGITYDSRKDGFRKYTFLYRFFRYETGKEGTKLNLFFLPIIW